MTTAADPRARILVRGFEDWVSLAEAAYLVRTALPEYTDSSTVRRETLRLVTELAGEELIEVGELTPLFHPWEGPDVLQRIEAGWPDPDQRLVHGDVCWFANTALGNAFAEEMLQRFGEQAP